MKALLITLFLAAQAMGEEISVASNPQITVPEESIIHGIVLIEANANPASISRKKGVQVELGKARPASLRAALEPYIGKPIDAEVLSEIKETIHRSYFRDKGSYVVILFPEQEIGDGILVLQILEGTVGKISYSGLQWMPESVLEKKIDLRPGDRVNDHALLNKLALLNQNPFWGTRLIYSPGQRRGTIDLDFVSEDRLPVRPFAGSDNTGFRDDNQNRLFAGFNWGNAFGRGDLFTYQYTAAPGFHRFQAHVASYTSFLPWEHILEAYACYAQIYPALSGLNVKGKNVQGSLRYQIPWKPFYNTGFSAYWEGGIDYKWQNSNLFFSGTPQQEVNSVATLAIAQMEVGYALRTMLGENNVNFKGQIFFSPWKDLFPHQTTTDFNNARPKSDPRYAYFRFALGDQWKFYEEWALSSLMRLQFAITTLPASEQFALGGYDTVRGYYEQQFLADDMICLNEEIYSPILHPFSTWKDQQLVFLAFLDWGYGHNHSAIEGKFIRQNLLGIGPGFRYDILPYFHCRGDYGFQLKAIPGGSLVGRFHFSIVADY